MGLMRLTENGGPFLGCRGWMWQIGGLRKEIEASVCGYGGSVDEMRCLICCWSKVYGSDRGGAGRGLRKNMGMADHRAGRGLRKKKMGMADHCERERQSLGDVWSWSSKIVV
ncbi:hypothetical protein CMV_029336 [Castanea mollissima]|uniref:Uncharacterized protein n=1 Tax=Castanea mollissima TaxID=60419 RepID=A0A8J4Q7T6_9ROSI|nr:hypothetical protein CMV_029336 [Castanea mollissima]